MRRATGFSLIELLIVIAVIALLSGMLMPMYGIVRASSMKSRTQVVLKKVEIGLRAFRVEWGAYPYQATYPAEIAPGSPFPNRLFRRLGGELDAATRAKVVADMDAAGGVYAYRCSLVPGGNNAACFTEGVQPSPLTYTWGAVGGAFHALFLAGTDLAWQNPNYGAMWMLNQAAQERTRIAVAAGHAGLRGPLISRSATAVAVDHTATAVLAAPASAAAPGMAADYLRGELEPSSLSGQDVVDAWGRPIVYICQAIPGMQGTAGVVWSYQVPGFDSRYMGLGPQGFDPASGPGPALIAGKRPLLLGGGRIPVGQGVSDAGDGLGPAPADAACLPDPARPQRSDVRYYATLGHQNEFELWSCGPDGGFAYLRDEAQNRDNIAALPYNRGLDLPGASP